MRLFSVNCDLDEIPNYHQIHGLPEPTGEGTTAVYDRALSRLCDLAAESHLPLTLFAVGADLQRPEAATVLRQAASAGHEIGNHTLDHMYEFSQLSKAGMRTQVEGGIRAIREATGVAPVGFRAPGYVVNRMVFEVLTELGVHYDSSVFPCPSYYAAKLAAVGKVALGGRTSRSIVDSPNVLRAPTEPYRIGVPYWEQGNGLIELPVQVTRIGRLPVIGTALTLAGSTGARLLARLCVGAPLVNLELHGIDLLDATDGLSALRGHQPDVSIPLHRKLDALRSFFAVLRTAGYEGVTLRSAAARLFA